MDVIESVEREIEAVEAETERYVQALERASVAAASAYGQAKADFEVRAEALRKDAGEAMEKAERVRADVEEEERRTAEVVGELEALKVRCVAARSKRAPPCSRAGDAGDVIVTALADQRNN